MFDATGKGFAGVLASNKVNGTASAYIDETDLTGSLTIGGNVLVKASDAAGIFSNVKLVSSSTVTNDGGAGILQQTIDAATPATYLTTPDGTTLNHIRPVKFGDTVRLADGYDTPAQVIGGLAQTAVSVNPGDVIQNNDTNNTLYRYVGSAAATFDLSGGTGPNVPDFTNASLWKQVGGTAGVVYQYMGPNDRHLARSQQHRLYRCQHLEGGSDHQPDPARAERLRFEHHRGRWDHRAQ